MTVNEACSADMDAVAKATGYRRYYFQTGSAPPHAASNRPRVCTVGRGYSVNAVLARTITAGGPHGYFAVAGGSYRSYVCAQVSTSEWKSVRVCTAHLSLGSQANRSLGAGKLQQAECTILNRDVLNKSAGYVLFAGDLNRSGRNQNCAPSRFHGLKDAKYGSARSITHDGLQHIYYSAGFWRQTCGWAYTVDSTDDHKGFLLELGKQGAAIVGVVRGARDPRLARPSAARADARTPAWCTAAMRVHHLNCGTMNPHVIGRIVCHVLLCETDAGLVLVDTGFGLADVADRPASARPGSCCAASSTPTRPPPARSSGSASPAPTSGTS